jgi:hypothetical protein
MITPGGFINPTSYLETEETSHEVEKYTNFLTGVTSNNPGFRVCKQHYRKYLDIYF